MRYSLCVICDRENTDSIRLKVMEMAGYLCFPGEIEFRPYWKDENCDGLVIGGDLAQVEADALESYIAAIAGSDQLTVNTSADSCEWACYRSTEELHTQKNAAFVVFNVF